ncbi:adenylyl-sulfate kinase [Candidatus Peregrinibacteria bacterium]|nr:adenylyl-sulfate kinase [Candidatus Peregrinibacteria bacterium]
MELIRLTTAGSVDDGKSTLIGRLLHDCNSIFEDKLLSMKNKAGRELDEEIDFALLTDGLEAEREQKITIDVAYLHFYTEKRHFLIADVPGHEQYTANMVTGASNSNLAMILVDVRKGMRIQSKRHLFILSLLGVKHVLIAVNKMDEVDYSKEMFEKVRSEFLAYSEKLEISDLQFIPISALKGDMLVKRGENMPWYNGRTLLDYLDNVEVSTDRNLIDLRLPVQMVLRPNQDFRGYCGRIESGGLKKGDKVIAVPSMKDTQVKQIFIGEEEEEFAKAAESVLVTLEDEIDLSRGDVIARKNNLPYFSDRFTANVCWMNENALKIKKEYLIKCGTRTVRGHIDSLVHKINIDTLHREKGESLNVNEVAKVKMRFLEPVIFDLFKKNRSTGSFVIIDEFTNDTVGAGVILGLQNYKKKEELKLKKGGVLWFTGLSGSGKSYIADKVYDALNELGVKSERLDGDIMREVVSSDLGFSKEDRQKNLDRAAYIANLLAKNGVLVLASFISPYKEQRERIKSRVKDYIEVFIDTPIEICEERDVKGLYKKARAGEIENFTGISHPYENPEYPEVKVDCREENEDESVEKIINYLKENGFLL